MVVVGGGVIGLSIALSLQKRGVPVTLLERDEIGKGASWGNAGHIATEQVFPVASPDVLRSIPAMLCDPLGPLSLDWRYLHKITPWLLRLLINMRKSSYQKTHYALLQLNEKSFEAWKRFVEEWKLSSLIKTEGSLLVAEYEKTSEKLKKHGTYLNSIGIQNEWVEGSQLQEIEPALANNQIGGLLYPKTGHVVDLNELLQRLLTKFRELGGEAYENIHVLKATKVSKRLVKLETSAGFISCEQVLISAGAYSKALTKQLTGVSVPLETERGYHLMLPCERGLLSIPVSSADRRFIMTPMNVGLRLAGTVEYAGLDLPPNMKKARNFIPLAQGMLKKKLKESGATEWMGFRPTVSDSLPVIDRVGGVYLAFGHQHLGLTHAAITAELLVAMFFKEQMKVDASAYRLTRFN